MTIKELTGDEIRLALSAVGRKKKHFTKTEQWRLATGLNQKALGPLLNGRSALELVVKMGGKRKPRKKG